MLFVPEGGRGVWINQMRTGSTVCYVKEEKSAEREEGIIINSEGLYDSAISDDRAQVYAGTADVRQGLNPGGAEKEESKENDWAWRCQSTPGPRVGSGFVLGAFQWDVLFMFLSCTPTLRC